ncbi:MAG: DEAD/DEAH box helicase [Elusimicrobia bacterium]|nr:DEAD/DEAH box helicase [Elusimicrobiota bacterium]
MPIPKAAVERYLSRPIESIAWYNDLKPLEVEYDLSFCRPLIKPRVPLRPDQKVVLLAALSSPGLVVMSDLGWGKTGLSLELLQYYYDAGFIRRAVVFAPTDEVAEGWVDEIVKWKFDVPYVQLRGSSRDKWEQAGRIDKGILIGTYAGISAMVSKLVPAVDKDGKSTGRNKREIVSRLILGMISRVDAVVFDQSTRLGSTDSLSYQVCLEFSREAQLRYSLAGRAFGRDPFVLWSQFFLTDGGRALGRSPGMFREAFWRRVVTPWGVSWKFRKRRESALAGFIAASSLRYSIDECVSLPPKVNLPPSKCTFPDENWDYYDRIVEELAEARGNYREVQNAFLRMRQISSGFVGFVDDDTGEKAQIEFEKNPKLDLLMELISEVPEDCKLIVFYEFTWSGARICQELSRRKQQFGWLWSGTKNWTSIKDKFNGDPDFRVIVAQWKKASMGLNLQAANYEFFYESPVSSIERYECEGRIYRTGQKRRSMIYDLVVRDSVDERILEFHQEGRDIFRTLVEDPNLVVGRRGVRKGTSK